MTNQTKPVNRSIAFWIGLAIHLVLGATLYHHTLGTGTGARQTEIKMEAEASTPAVP